MKFLIIILACLSFWSKSVFGQDLEHVIQPKPVPQIEKDTNTLDEEALTGFIEISEDVKKEQSQVYEDRDPATYRKEEYINKLLRHTYYQRLLIPAWLKYVSPDAWKENFTKWRYWTQLKNYLARNDAEVLVLRSIASSPQNDSLMASEILLNEDSLKAIGFKEDSITRLAVSDTQITVQSEESRIPEFTAIEVNPLQEALNEQTLAPSSKKEVDQRTKEVTPPVAKTKPTPKVQDANEVKEVTTTHTVEKEDPSKELPALLKRESEQLENISAPFNEMKGRLPWPVKNGKVTDGFGFRKNYEERGLRPENYGIDMVCPPGAIVSAVHDGVVLMARRQSPYDFIVTVKHGPFTTAYYFLINTYVQPGDEVKRGQALGQLRTSVAEADFHFEIWNNQDRINPELWLKNR